MFTHLRCLAGLSMIALLASGCTQQPAATDESTPTSNSQQTVGTRFLLASEPNGAEDVIQVRSATQDADEVVVVGRIGGSPNPWIEGQAAFSIVDRSLKACSDIPGDTCPMPWDYCCETSKLPTATALVKVVDENGTLIKTDARELLDVEELSTVVVKGKAQRDEAGNLTVLASGVYIRK